MTIAITIPRKPASINAGGKGKIALQEDIKAEIRRQFGPSIVYPTEYDLYVRITWFRTRRAGPDTDNVSKFVVDALKNCAFTDDSQVAKCLVQTVNTAVDIEWVETTVPNGARAAFQKLEAFIANAQPHILYIEVGRIPDPDIRFGPIDEVSKMNSVAEYLEAAKTTELAESYRQRGYAVETQFDTVDSPFDLLAHRDGKTIAFVVTARTELSNASGDLVKQREIARQKKYELRVVVVNPPHRTNVEIEDFGSKVTTFLSDRMPSELRRLSPHTSIDGVSDFEIDEVEIKKDGTRIGGTGVVELTLEYAGGQERDGLTTGFGVPFDFNIVLDHELNISDGGETTFQFDTSSFYEE